MDERYGRAAGSSRAVTAVAAVAPIAPIATLADAMGNVAGATWSTCFAKSACVRLTSVSPCAPGPSNELTTVDCHVASPAEQRNRRATAICANACRRGKARSAAATPLAWLPARTVTAVGRDIARI